VKKSIKTYNAGRDKFYDRNKSIGDIINEAKNSAYISCMQLNLYLFENGEIFFKVIPRFFKATFFKTTIVKKTIVKKKCIKDEERT
jgi:hypothetical protein